jgi:hypothetical protein
MVYLSIFHDAPHYTQIYFQPVKFHFYETSLACKCINLKNKKQGRESPEFAFTLIFKWISQNGERLKSPKSH